MAKLIDSEMYTRAILETAVDGIITINEDGVIESINSAATKMFGYRADEMLGQNVTMLMPSPHKEQHDAYIQKYLKTGEKKIIGIGREIVAQKKDGTIFPVALAVSEVQLEDKIIFTGIIHDITERKQIEAELIKSREHLEEQVSERTKDLLLANERLQVVLEEKEMLLKETHHRVKNNLQIISSLFQLQADQSTNRELQSILKECQNRVDSMALIHERLYHSENLANIDFGKYIQELVPDIFHSYTVHSANVALKVEAEEIALGIDTAIPCSLILNELLSNSLKYAFPHGRKGNLCVKLCQKEDKDLELTVSDNGIGLPVEVDFSRTKSLGLRLVRILTNQLRGTAEVDRSSGTTFVITFREKTND